MFILNQTKDVAVNMNVMRAIRQHNDELLAIYDEDSTGYNGYILGKYYGDIRRTEILEDILKKMDLGEDKYFMPEQ